MMQEKPEPQWNWTYHLMYISTGEVEVVTQNRFSPDCIRYETIFEAVNDWNRLGGITFKYWV